MSPDAPQVEPARTRRSHRTATTPAQVSPVVVPVSRAEQRRRAAAVTTIAAAAAELAPSASELVPAEAAPAVAESALPVAEPVEAPVSRRTRRAAVQTPVEPFELLEPEISAEPSVAEPVEAPAPEHPVTEPSTPVAEPVDAHEIDEFEAAARLFSFTGELPVFQAETEESETSQPVADTVARGARRRRGLVTFKRVAATSFSIGVMGVVGLLTVGLTTPVEAVAGAEGVASIRVAAATDLTVDDEDEAIQAYVAPSDAANTDLTRSESYSTMSMAEFASEQGIAHTSNLFVNDPNAAIQWPFAVGVPMSYGFGMRSGVMHEGIDFTPGEGAPIQAIADGVVRVATNSGGGYGVHVIIDHEIDGQLVSSHYAHMIYGSIEVEVGQKVTVGTVIGHTGNTGRSFGAHTHFEILMNGTTPIDPLPWLREHTGG